MAKPPASELAAVDVSYSDTEAVIGGITFAAWTDSEPTGEYVVTTAPAASYVPGEFYRRELPCVLRMFDTFPVRPSVVIVDGYVWLDERATPGLGAHVWDALDHQVVVVGVAKRMLHTRPACCEVIRGRSVKPLYVSAVGMPQPEAARLVSEMHGTYRIPTLLRRVDQLSRGVAIP